MPGKHAPASPRSFYVSAGKALGAALGAVALMVVAVLVLLGRDDGKGVGSPAIQTSRPSTKVPSPHPSTASPTPKATPTLLPASQTIVDVLNGTKRNGLARSTGKKITDAGYRLGKVGNAPTSYEKSTLFYLPGRRAEALAFQEAFPEFTVLKQARFSGGAILQAIIGADYP
jgi:hypothetical protein